MYTVVCQNTLKEKKLLSAVFTYCLMELYSSLSIYPILYVTHDLLIDMALEKMPVPV